MGAGGRSGQNERCLKAAWAGAEVRIIKNNRAGMKGAYGNAGANIRFRRHRLLSLPALEDLAGSSSPPLGPTEGKTERTQKPITFWMFIWWHLSAQCSRENLFWDVKVMSRRYFMLRLQKQRDFLHTSSSPPHIWVDALRKLLRLLECKAMPLMTTNMYYSVKSLADDLIVLRKTVSGACARL